MSFIRKLDTTQINKMTSGDNAELFQRLKTDIISGRPSEAVFPAVRKNELYFYYKGGCLYKFSNGSFRRDKAFERYGCGTDGLDPYETAKKQNENKFTDSKGGAKERRLLNELYCHTYDRSRKTNVVVIDIEVNLNGIIGAGKKCDLVFLNTLTNEIMFVEGKVFYDNRVDVKLGKTPEVIRQVHTYADSIYEQKQNIIDQYGEYVRIVNELFGTAYHAPENLKIPAKLLVYETPLRPTANQAYSIDKINSELGAENVAWYTANETPSTDDIWSALCG